MSNLPGNPYANVNVDYADTNDGRINGEAILALAYEQRTTNLIAYMSHADSEQYEAIWRELKARLGLGDNNE
ncbi:hypothetical protein [Glutamicibacter mishrai]|uniref:hypothetical protein n=1 Tax=Glutamicibacter mishrai TaxID=1775880 RepID=UPI003F79F666